MSLTNVGLMRNADLRGILKSFPEGHVNIAVTDIYTSVVKRGGKRDGETLMTAAKISRSHWHVRAIPGLIRTA